MNKGLSLTETLQQLLSKGYQLADTLLTSYPSERIQSNDWRLDSMYQVKTGGDVPVKSLVIAVSSSNRSLKLVFVEEGISRYDFSPMQILRRLFPFPNRH